MNDESTSQETNRTSTGRFIGRIALELVTVFVGVTLAFLFDNYKQERSDREHQRQLQKAVVAEIEYFDQGVSSISKRIQAGVEQFDSLRAAGKKPVPYYLRVQGAERVPTDVWQAVMQSGASELFDSDLMVELSSFYNEVSGEATRYQRYTTFTERRIFPLLESDTTAFYDPRTGDLKPEFKAHMRQVKEIAADFRNQAETAHKLSAELSGRLK